LMGAQTTENVQALGLENSRRSKEAFSHIQQ
jgi:hypothetical protein